jgi:hypothetical protein
VRTCGILSAGLKDGHGFGSEIMGSVKLEKMKMQIVANRAGSSKICEVRFLLRRERRENVLSKHKSAADAFVLRPHCFIVFASFLKKSREQTMSNITCCYAYAGCTLPANMTLCDGSGEVLHNGSVNVVGITVFWVTVVVLCSLAFCNALLREVRERKLALAQLQENEESKEERKRKRKESILDELIVKEWVPVDQTVESTERDQDTPPPGEAVEAPQPPAPPNNSSLSPASCVMGSDDCDSLAGEDDDMAGCAICLSPFKPQELVTESSNSSCQHVFHKDCMVDWLMKRHDNCPMCREVYLLKTVW